MKKKILLVLLSLVCVFSVALGLQGLTSKNVRAAEIAFTNNNCYRAQKTYHGLVNSFETTINVAKDTGRQIIIGNYVADNHESFSFEIHSGNVNGVAYGGRPRIYFVYHNGTEYTSTDAVFGKYKDDNSAVDVRGMGDVKIIITIARTKDAATARCWINGRECLEVATSAAMGVNKGIYNTVTYNYATFMVGSDYRRNASYSDSRNVIKNITLFSTDRSSNAASDSKTFVKSGTGVICAYDLAGKGGVNTIKDESGNGYDLYIAPNYVQNPIDKSNGVTFSTGQYYKFTDVVDFPINSFEASVTVKAGSSTRGGVILGNYQNDNKTALNFELYENNKMRVYARVKDSSGTYTKTEVIFNDTTLNTAGTYHIAVTIDRVTKVMKYYINGELKETKTYTGLLGATETFNSNVFRIGADCRADSTCTFKGTIHSVAIFSSIRTADNVTTDDDYVSTTTNGVKGYYNFGGKQGQKIVKDISNNGKNLFYSNTSSNNITFTKNDLYQADKKLSEAPNTFEAWINVPANIGDSERVGVIAGNYNDFNLLTKKPNNFSFEVHENGKPRIYFRFNGDDSRSEVKFNYDVRTGIDTHVAITVNRTNQKATLYINGEIPIGCENVSFTNLDVSSKLDANDKTDDYPIVIGNDYRVDKGNSRFKGTIYSVAIYSSVKDKAGIRNDFETPSKTNALVIYDLTNKSGATTISDTSGNGNTLRIDNNIETIWQQDNYYLQNKKLDRLPLTVEAVIYLPKNYSSRAGVIIGSYGQSRECFNFELHTGNKLRFYYTDNAGKNLSAYSTSGITTGEWVHVAATLRDGNVYFYQNGQPFGSPTGLTSGISTSVNFTTPLVVGGDLRSESGANNGYNFKGYIKGVSAYNVSKTDDGIATDYKRYTQVNGFYQNSNLMFAYDLQNVNGASTIQDCSSNKIDLTMNKAWLQESEVSISNYDYSFAVVGDTQKIIRQYDNYLTGDTTDENFPQSQTFPKVYDYILNNASSKKIAHVFGLGDVTETYPDWGEDHPPERSLREYQLAYEQFSRLDSAGLSYSIVRGNHDDTTNFNTFFGTSSSYANQYSEYYGGSYNSAHFFTAGELDYMVVTLNYGASDDILAWANDIISRHPNRNVIVTTHAFLFRDGTTLSSGDVVPASPNDGEAIWNKLIKNHPNIVLTLSGHDPCNAIVAGELTGDKGNKIQNLLIDPQGLDDAFNSTGGVGAVAMLYFSNGGKTVEVRWWSTARNCYIRTNNQFTITLNTIESEFVDETSVWDGSFPDVSSGYDFTGHGTEKHPYLIFTAQDLAALSALSVGQNYGNNKHYKLMRSINLSCGGWVPICDNSVDFNQTTYGTGQDTFGGWQGGNPGDSNWKAFGGVLDGNNKTISFNETKTITCFALFMGLRSATVKNLNLTGQIYSSVYTSALCVLVHGQTTIENVTSSVDITVATNANDYRQARAGAMAGQVNGSGSTFINCVNTGDIICTDKDEKIGGIVGFAYGVVELQNCTNSGKIKGRVEASEPYGVQPTYVGNLIGDYFSKKVTITWVVGNTTVTSEEGWGHIAVYKRANVDDAIGVPPTKASDNALLKYEFAGWGISGENGTDVVARVPLTNETLTSENGITYYARFTTLCKITIATNEDDWDGNAEYGSVAITQSDSQIDEFSFWAYKGAGFTKQGNLLTITGTAYINEVEKTTITKVTATPATPTAQYTFVFSGWEDATAEIGSYRTITANFDATTNSYTVTISVNNTDYGSVTQTSIVVPYGTNISCLSNVLNVGETQVTANVIELTGYTTTFSYWSLNCSQIVEDTSVVAYFTRTINIYTITWKNDNGSVIKTDSLEYGSMPSYSGETPTKQATAEFTYTFKGWSPELVMVTENAIYTATYNATTNTYTITWRDEDGTVLEVDENVPYGTMPEYNGETPIKADTDEITYMFNGWSPSVAMVVGNATYRATFKALASLSSSLTIKGSVGINFYLDVNKYVDLTVFRNAYVELEYNHNKMDYTPNIKIKKILLSTMTPEMDDGTYKFTIDFASGQISEDIALRLFNGVDLEPVYEKKNYSIYDYCKSVVSNESYPQKLRDLCQGLINYGYYSKNYFKYTYGEEIDVNYVNNLPNSINQNDVKQSNVSGSATNFKFVRYSFVALSETSIRIYFNVDNGYDKNSYDISLSKPTDSQMNFKTGWNDYGYFVEVYGIEPANIDKSFSVTIKFKGDDTATTITYSALNYLQETINKGANGDLKNMCLAIYQYNLCAKQYFNNGENGFYSEIGDLTIQGGSIVVGEKDMQIVSDGGDAVAFSNVVAKNVEYSADIKMGASGAGALLIRADGTSDNFYSINIDKNANIVKFWKKVDGQTTIIAERFVSVNEGEFYNLKVVALSANIKAYLNGALLIDVYDYALAEGKLGLNVYQTNATFNNIKYTILNAEESNLDILGGTTAKVYASTSINNGVIDFNNIGMANALAIGETTASNLTISANIAVGGEGAGAIVFRYQNQNNYYSVNVDTMVNVVKLWKMVNGKDDIITQYPLTVIKGEFYNIKAVVNGASIKIYLNNSLVLEALDSDFITGKVGLNTWVTDCYFKDIVIEQGANGYSYFSQVTTQNATLTENSGTFTLDNQNGGDAFAVGSASCNNFTISGDISLNGVGAGSFIIRYQDQNNFYCVNIDNSGANGVVKVWKKVNGVTQECFKKEVATINSNTFYNLKITIIGESITVYLNDTQVISCTDNSISYGKIGLNSWNTDIVVKNIKCS